MTDIKISAQLLQKLEKAERKLNALEGAGVDNWDGYDDALAEIRKEEYREQLADDLIDEIGEIIATEIDGNDDGVPLTEPEMASLRAWFYANHQLAVECANAAADWGPDPDDERDRRRDDRMMGICK